MPVPDQVRDDGSGIQKPFNLLDSGFQRNDGKMKGLTIYEVINFHYTSDCINSSNWLRFWQGRTSLQQA
jgi:hypothetical protein